MKNGGLVEAVSSALKDLSQQRTSAVKNGGLVEAPTATRRSVAQT